MVFGTTVLSGESPTANLNLSIKSAPLLVMDKMSLYEKHAVSHYCLIIGECLIMWYMEELTKKINKAPNTVFKSLCVIIIRNGRNKKKKRNTEKKLVLVLSSCTPSKL